MSTAEEAGVEVDSGARGSGGSEASPRARPEGPADVVTVRLPASATYLALLRTTTASLAARLDFTIEEIEDLRIAVDEASSLLLASAVPGSELACSFEAAADSLRVTVCAVTIDAHPPSRDTFAWTVLTALAGEVDAHAAADGTTTVVLVKRRASAV